MNSVLVRKLFFGSVLILRKNRVIEWTHRKCVVLNIKKVKKKKN